MKSIHLCCLVAIVLQQSVSQQHAHAEEPPPARIAISTADRSPSVQHRIVNGQYQIEIKHTVSMIGRPSVEFIVESKESGAWTESSVTHGDNLNVKQNGRSEPRSCSVRLAQQWSADPAGDYEAEVRNRIEDENGKVSDEAARREIDRLVNQYGLTLKHVLKLPRSAANRSEPVKTLARLCRWMTYDKLFLKMQMDPRPIATESDADAIYQQVMKILNGEPLPENVDEHLLTVPEQQRMQAAFQFTYSVNFIPHLHDEQSEANWRHALRVKFEPSNSASVDWTGELSSGDQRSAWLAFPSTINVRQIKVNQAHDDKSIQWNIVTGQNGWNYLRVARPESDGVGTFKIQIVGDPSQKPIKLIQSRPRDVEFPF
ncbi:hypothetical protein [Stieleria varia]|uniref:Uncharacterized protein n=1 Tax=Stieleria varia TaxID=2528005 RepID=A0A5C6B174_9BACT|nr:hypothetical protein [Stieleria varia]TWU05620.1 hypothetical protein Pla52n_13350 [Stieleria varia]